MLASNVSTFPPTSTKGSPMPRKSNHGAELDALAMAICGDNFSAIGRKQGITAQGATKRCLRAIARLQSGIPERMTYAAVSSRDMVKRMDAAE